MLFTSAILLNACDNRQNNPLDEKLKSGQSFFSMVYNPTFADRFNLDRRSIVDLDDGLHAIAIEISKINDSYQCFLHLYVNDELDIYRPAEGNFFSDKTAAEYFFVNSYNDTDQSWNSSEINRNVMRILFRSNSLNNSDEEIVSTLQYERIHRSFLPGLTIISINAECPLLEKKYYPAQIWIQKQSANNYLLGNDNPAEPTHRQNNLIFQIPTKLIDKISPYIKITTNELILE